MSLPNGADVELGGIAYKLDRGYERATGRRCYAHGGRALSVGGQLVGRSGQEIADNRLVWYITDFDGEGQTSVDPADPDSPRLYYRSEGIDFKTAGQGSLNKMLRAEIPDSIADGGTTVNGSAFSDVTGTSTVISTNYRRLNATNATIRSDNIAGGTGTSIEAHYYVYHEAFADYATTIQGSAFVKTMGDPSVDTTDMILPEGSAVRSATITGLDTSAPYRAEFVLNAQYAVGFDNPTVTVQVIDVTDGNYDVVATRDIPSFPTTTTTVALDWVTPAGSASYVFVVNNHAGPGNRMSVLLDKMLYGREQTDSTVTISAYNSSLSSVVDQRDVVVRGEAYYAEVGVLTFLAPAGNNWQLRVKWKSGYQRPVVAKVVWYARNDSNYALNGLDLGLGDQTNGVFTPQVWLSGYGVGQFGFVYDPSGDKWDVVADNDSATGGNLQCRAMAHSDTYEYFLYSSGEVIAVTAAGVDARYYYGMTTPVGMTVAQNRLFLLDEGGGDTTVYCAPLEHTPGALDVQSDPTVRNASLGTGTKTPDIFLRHRMCSTPNGARFFVNFGDVHAKVYECDASGSTLATREIADLGSGVKATCIAYESGLTFIGGWYYGYDPWGIGGDFQPRPALWYIDQNGVTQRIGLFREDDPSPYPPMALFPYQEHLYILQGKYLWRYSLVTGGLYCEYEIPTIWEAYARSLAVLAGRVMVLYERQLWVTHYDGRYPTGSISGGSSHVSSIFDFGYPQSLKRLTKITLLTDTLPTNTAVKVEYQIDQSGTWVPAGIAGEDDVQRSFNVTNITFSTLQVRTTLISMTGEETPVWKATVIECEVVEQEEYFNLVLLCEDADSSSHIAGEQEPGSTKSANIMDLWRQKAITTFRDGYAAKPNPLMDDYLVTVTSAEIQQNALGEGRAVVGLRVVSS